MIPKKVLLSLSVLMLAFLMFVAYKQNSGPYISRQAPVWELNGQTEVEYKAALATEAETTKRFNAFTGLPQFTQVSTEDVMYHTTAEGTEVSGYLAMPEGEGPFPGIIMIHEWRGLNEQVKGMARDYAGQGYAVLAVDLYDGELGPTPEEARALATRVRGLPEPAFANLRDAMAYLDNLNQVDGERLASLGWCFGGGWSYEMAKNNLGTKASVIYYGQFNPEDDLSIMNAKIQGYFGDNDQLIPVDDVLTFRAKLDTLNGEHQVFIYENSGHAFANEDSDAYQEASAQQARERTLTFLNENL